jgi:hypothetical protein
VVPVDDERVQGEPGGDIDDALVSRLKVIEDQALDTRAEAYGQLHEELRRRLEDGDSHRP